MKVIQTEDPSFEAIFSHIRQRGKIFDEKLQTDVKRIVDDVARKGDESLFEYTKKFDGHSINRETVMVSPKELDALSTQVRKEDLDILKLAAERIEIYHRKQRIESWYISDEKGIKVGQRVVPMERVGIYAPGGLAAYPSTVLMAAIPAKIAGVKEIVLASPAKNGQVHPLIAAAARLCNIKKIFKVGGAQAIAALAYGTASIPRVDIIVGPGNAYVAAAKKMVFGQVAIDMIAGPSEVLVISDGTPDASLAAADLLSQAEHDEVASAILLTPDKPFAQEVSACVDEQLQKLPKKIIAMHSLSDYGAIIITKDMDEAVSIANRFAPEHLELMVANPQKVLKKIKHAGAVFLGHSTPEALGDYIGGPNHILPTGGTARFASPLGVYDFLKRTSILSFSNRALQKYGHSAARFAEMEGLTAHSSSITIRMNRKKS
jgi:histidinol dehydrogenase